jgi:hypothetical protein
MATQINDGQLIENLQTAVMRLVRQYDTVEVSNEYLPMLLRMAADQKITINSRSSKKNYTDVSAFPVQ